MKRQLILLTGFCLLALNISQAQQTDYLKQGNDCFDRGDYERAKNLYNVQKIQFATEGMDEKMELCDKCSGIKTVADFLFKDNDYAKAKAKYQELLAANPKDPHAKAQIDLCNAAVSPSVTGLNTAREDYLKKANDYFKSGEYQNAIQNYNLYKTFNPQGQNVDEQIKKATDCQQYLGVANFLYEKKDYENAMAEFTKVLFININDTYAKTLYDLCKSELELEKAKKTAETQQPAPLKTQPATQTQPANQRQNTTSTNNYTSSGKLTDPIGSSAFAFGISGGLVMANFMTSVSGSFLGGAVNYGYSYNHKQPSYSSKAGYSVGLILDIHLKNNIYLQTGIDYINANVKNSFVNSGDFKINNFTSTSYVIGSDNDDYEELFELNYVEIPFLLSYRFNLSQLIKRTNFQLNVGPYIGYGISGNCKITGTTHSSWDEYYSSNDVKTGRLFEDNSSFDGVLKLFDVSGSWSKTDFERKEIGGTYYYNNIYDDEYEDFSSSPFQKINAGIRLGAAFEIYGFNIGFSYDFGLLNMANDEYWSSDRMEITNRFTPETKMEGYQHTLNKFQLKVAYIFRR